MLTLRPRKGLAAALLLLVCLEKTTLATSIALLRRDGEIVVAADSLRTIVSTGARTSVCKVHFVNGTVFAFAGVNAPFDPVALVAPILATTASLKEAVPSMEAVLRDALTEYLAKLQEEEPEALPRLSGFKSGRLLTGFFGRFDGSTAYAGHIELLRTSPPDQPPALRVATTIYPRRPEMSPVIAMTAGSRSDLAHAHYLDHTQAHKAGRGASLAATMIQAEIDAAVLAGPDGVPDQVDEPVAVAVLTQRGLTWHMPGLCSGESKKDQP